ncbi:MAG: S8 family serine peptidase [Verrucomicrobiota bacterium]
MDERQDQIVAGNLSSDFPSGPGYLAWLAGKGFTQAQFGASGFVVDMSDSGIDNGTLKPGHFGLYPLGDTSKNSRVAYIRLEGTATPNPPSTLKGCDGHGTLNTHIVAGYDDLGGFPFADSTGYSYGLGVCPFVKVGSSVIFDPDTFTSPDYTTLETQAYDSGARVCNNSWGATNGASYDLDAQTYDTLVRDVGASSLERQMVIVFVAGNGGPSAQSIISPGTAKNVITVGAADNVRSLAPADGGNSRSGSDGCGNTDSDADNANAVVGFSSQGPCSDGRMKPDLVAPGTHVTGGVPQSGSATTNGTGAALSCFLANGDGICGVPGSSTADLFFPLGQEFYTVSTGTSHAAPAVSGACALVRQYFLNDNLVAPSPAMTKAFLMNSARYMTGANAGDTLWSPSQGMGELDLGGAFDGVPRILRDQVDRFTATGQTRTFTGTITDSTQPFRVTVAWTDPPGSLAAARALVNDLDLTVTVGGETYKGNVFSGATSVAGGTADSLNNVESVFLPAGTSGSFTVTITAADIAADALAIGGSIPEQDFALVVYNANPTALPFASIAASYRGLFYPAGEVEFLQSGAFSLTTGTRGGYSGTLQMGAKLYAFSGHLDSSGAGTNLIHRTGTNALALAFQMDSTNFNGITGTVTDGSWLAELQAERAPFKAGNSTLLAGKYTLVFPGYADGGALAPQGDGYGAVTVTKPGQILLSGALSDGAALSKTALLVGTGDWPLYVSLYGGRGQILGWLTFTNSQSLGGRFSWIKQPIPKAALYPGGFDIETNAVGSSFHSPSTSAGPILDFITGRVVLNGGDLAAPITNNVIIASNNKVTDTTFTNKLTLTLGTGRGLFRGTVLNPATGKKFGFNGVLLQNQGVGLGYFLGTNQSGSVFLGQ